MKRRIVSTITKYLPVIFPNPIAYVHFFLLWVFFLVMVTNREPTIVLVSALATIYCYNEWRRERRVEKTHS